ncbi:hypothetical protein LI328DRAFT_164794 [Trichoderma asperelloides]|nr:hypothetical protein LI328DRAFT_164794 [Trichoderma asperelloides]
MPAVPVVLASDHGRRASQGADSLVRSVGLATAARRYLSCYQSAALSGIYRKAISERWQSSSGPQPPAVLSEPAEQQVDRFRGAQLMPIQGLKPLDGQLKRAELTRAEVVDLRSFTPSYYHGSCVMLQYYIDCKFHVFLLPILCYTLSLSLSRIRLSLLFSLPSPPPCPSPSRIRFSPRLRFQ